MTIILIPGENAGQGHPGPFRFFVREMYVCVCNGVTDHDIRQAAAAGCRSVAELTMRTGCGACCGTCLDTAAETLEASRAERGADVLPLLSQAA